MRLLRREQSAGSNDFTFSLVERDFRTIYYAILSHRWGEEEVTYENIRNGTGRDKQGFKKLEFCAAQAERDGLQYFWIDTCCIKKESSAELTEAINSMFKWYQTAAKCYVYLPDVSTHGPEGWEAAFERSQWFTRGWTLQELIAPGVVEFFSSEGSRLGDKQSLEEQIHRVTGLSIEVLRGRSLHEFDHRERFAWAAKRRTTVEEDAIYCLLGIFGVYMPLIYGEGEQNARARLRRELQLLKTPVPSVEDGTWMVPLARNSNFTGRASQLSELEGRLFTDRHASRMAISGLGGVGKTSLLLELLYKVRERRRDCSIFWISAVTRESIQQGFAEVAKALKLPHDQDVDVIQETQAYLSDDDTGPWVLVFSRRRLSVGTAHFGHKSHLASPRCGLAATRYR